MDDFNCTCATGFEGRMCQIDIDDCDGVTCPGDFADCIDGVDSYQCGCLPGYKSKSVHEIASDQN